MKIPEKKVVFISYSWKDQSIADRVRDSIPDKYEVWIDRERIQPGDSISNKIREGLTGSDYYVLLIGEQSNHSAWVKQEIATAFELANSKGLSVVPVLLNDVEVPFEFKGLLYIDFRESVAQGLEALQEFFTKQASIIDEIEPKHIMLKSESEPVRQRRACNEALRRLSLGDLRYLISERLNLDGGSSVV